MTMTQSKAFCMSCVIDREIDPQTGRCERCGHQVLKASTEPVRDRNNGAGAKRPLAAYRSPVEPFDKSRSVMTTLPAPPPEPPPDPDLEIEAEPEALPLAASVAEPGAGPEAALLSLSAPPPPPMQAEVAPAPAPAQPPPEWIAATRALADGFLSAALDEDRLADEARAQASTHALKAKSLRQRAAIFSQLLLQVDVEPVPPKAPESSNDRQIRAVPAGLRWSRNSAVQVDACLDCHRADVPHIANGRCRTCDGHWRAAGQPRKAGAT